MDMIRATEDHVFIKAKRWTKWHILKDGTTLPLCGIMRSRAQRASTIPKADLCQNCAKHTGAWEEVTSQHHLPCPVCGADRPHIADDYHDPLEEHRSVCSACYDVRYDAKKKRDKGIDMSIDTSDEYPPINYKVDSSTHEIFATHAVYAIGRKEIEE